MSSPEPARVAASIERAFESLATQQEQDGSWKCYRGTAKYPLLVPDTRGYGVAMVLTALQHTAYEHSEVAQRARAYLQTQMLDDLLFTYDGRDHEYCCGKYHRTGSLLPPDLDDTALAHSVLWPHFEVHPEGLSSICDWFEKTRNRDGLYHSWIIGYYSLFPDRSGLPETVMFLPSATDVSLGVNLNVLAFFLAVGLPAEELTTAIRHHLESPGYRERLPYYSLPVNAFLAARASRLGEQTALDVVSRILGDVEQHGTGRDLARLNTVDLATYLTAKSAVCGSSGGGCAQTLAEGLEILLARQAVDGSWEGAPTSYSGPYEDREHLEKHRARFEGRSREAFEERGIQSFDVGLWKRFLAYYGKTGGLSAISTELDFLAETSIPDTDGRLLALADAWRQRTETPGAAAAVEKSLAALTNDPTLSDQLYHSYIVLFEGAARIYYGSTAQTTAFALRALIESSQRLAAAG